VRFEGRDVAGNQFEKIDNSESSPAGQWDLVHHTPDFTIDRNGIELSKYSLEVDEPTIVQIHIRNSGMLGGNAELLVEIVDLNGARSELTKTSVFVDAESVSTVVVDWKPEFAGVQRVEVTLLEQTEKSDFLEVKTIQDRSFLEDSIGATNPWILGITLIMFSLGIVFIFSWLRLATVSQGESELSWEYEDEDESEYEDESED
jgi:hypothetical protein